MLVSDFKIGQLVTCIKDKGRGSGAVYRVIAINKGEIELSLVFSAFPSIGRWKTRFVRSNYNYVYSCWTVSIEDLKATHKVLEAFIAGEMNR